MNKIKSYFNLKTVAMACLLALASIATAHAQVDTTAIEGSFTQTATSVNTIGGLMLTAVGAGIVFKWILGFVL